MISKDIKKIQELYDSVINFKKLILENRDIWGATLVPEVRQALLDWSKLDTSDGVVIGGCVLGVYGKPRTTTDADILYLEGESSIPNYMEGFKRTRKHAFVHEKTGVEIEVLSPEYLKLRKEVVEYVKFHNVISGGIKIASKNSLIVLKAQRLLPQDEADIFSLFEITSIFPEEILEILTPFQQSEVERLWNLSKNNNFKLEDE